MDDYTEEDVKECLILLAGDNDVTEFDQIEATCKVLLFQYHFEVNKEACEYIVELGGVKVLVNLIKNTRNVTVIANSVSCLHLIADNSDKCKDEINQVW